jgi:hypothetical protein
LARAARTDSGNLKEEHTHFRAQAAQYAFIKYLHDKAQGVSHTEEAVRLPAGAHSRRKQIRALRRHETSLRGGRAEKLENPERMYMMSVLFVLQSRWRAKNNGPKSESKAF